MVERKNIAPSSRAENAYLRLHIHVSAFLQENLLQLIKQQKRADVYNYALKNTTLSSPAAKAHSWLHMRAFS